MARDRMDIEVDGVEYTYRQISPTKATLTFCKLVKIFGPVAAKLYGTNPANLQEAKNIAGELGSMNMGDIIESVVDRIDEDQLMNICRKLLSDCRPKKSMTLNLGNESDLDKHLEDTPGMLHFFKLMKEVLRLQYADFFAGLRTLGSEEEKAQVQVPSIGFPMVP